MDMTSIIPKVSFGLPVRNGERHIARVLDSLLGQDLEDIEVVVSDNASDDRTADICREYAARDGRVRLSCNEENLGQIANFNRVLELARGTYYRWIGVNDWLEPNYASQCAAELDAHPEAVAVSTLQDFASDEGVIPAAEYPGERLESDRPERRFQRMLWFFHADFRYFDPIYSMIRREALLGTQRLLFMWDNDQLLSAELALLGPWRHVSAVLSHRYREPSYYGATDRLRRQYDPRAPGNLRPSNVKLGSEMVAVVQRYPLSKRQQCVCGYAIARYLTLIQSRRWNRRLRNLLRPMIPSAVLRRMKQVTGPS